MEYVIIKVEESRVLAAWFDISGRSAGFNGFASFDCDNGNSLPQIAAQIAERLKSSPRIVLCLPPALFAQRTVELPLSDLRKVREVLPGHLQGEIALAVEEAVFDVLPAADGRFLALWAKRAEISQAIDIFRAAGCEPQIVTSAPLAWSRLPEIPDYCVVSDGSALAVIAQGRLSYVRALTGEAPHRQVTETIAALELSGVILPSRMVLFGELATQRAELEGLTPAVECLELPDSLVPLFKTEAAFQELAGMYAVARAAHEGMVADFRRGDLAWTAGDAKLRKQLIRTAILAAVAVALLFISKGLQYRAAKADLASLNRSIAVMYKEIFPNRAKAVDELAEVRGEIKKLTGVESSGSVLDCLRKLAEAKGATINGLYEAELEGRTLRVKGDARSAQAVNDFKTALASLTSTSELGEIKSRPDGSVGFSLTATLKESPK